MELHRKMKDFQETIMKNKGKKIIRGSKSCDQYWKRFENWKQVMYCRNKNNGG